MCARDEPACEAVAGCLSGGGAGAAGGDRPGAASICRTVVGALLSSGRQPTASLWPAWLCPCARAVRAHQRLPLNWRVQAAERREGGVRPGHARGTHPRRLHRCGGLLAQRHALSVHSGRAHRAGGRHPLGRAAHRRRGRAPRVCHLHGQVGVGWGRVGGRDGRVGACRRVVAVRQVRRGQRGSDQVPTRGVTGSAQCTAFAACSSATRRSPAPLLLSHPATCCPAVRCAAMASWGT